MPKIGLRFLFGILILTSFSCKSTSNTPKTESIAEIFQKVIENYNSKTSVSFNYTESLKFFNKRDTNHTKSKCVLIRDRSDSLYNGYIAITIASQVGKYYNTQNIYDIRFHDTSYTKYPGTQEFKKIMIGNGRTRSHQVYFLKPEKLLEFVDDTAKTAEKLEDQEWRGSTFHVIRFYSPDLLKFRNLYKEFWINKADYTIGRMKQRVELDDKFQWEDMRISDYDFTDLDPKELEKGMMTQLSKMKEVAPL